MIDDKWIVRNPDEFDKHMQARKCDITASQVLAAREAHLSTFQQLQDLRTARNKLSIVREKTDADILQARHIKEEIKRLESEQDSNYSDLLLSIPNILSDEVPTGKSEKDNVVQYVIGEKPKFTHQLVDHFDMFGIDAETAGKISGSRFTILRGKMARLERAIGQYMLDSHTANGYEEVNVPVIVNSESLVGTGQLPKFSEDLYSVGDKYLIPTAEVPLTNILASTLDNVAETYRFTALSNCFRSEAGAAGKDTRGMIRQHQFNKVELVSILPEAQAREELNRTLSCAEQILKDFGLHYRVVKLCSGDIGFSSRLTYDIEVWLPTQNKYREISSVSWCGDFQARRMNAMYRDGITTKHYHTINGSGLAVGRTLIALLDNFQNEQGEIIIPEVLRKYTGFDLIDTNQNS